MIEDLTRTRIKKPKRIIQSIDFGTKNANPISSSKKSDSSYKKDNSSYKKPRKNNKIKGNENQKKKLEYGCEEEDRAKQTPQESMSNMIPKHTYEE